MFMASNQFKIPNGREGTFEKARAAQRARLRLAPGCINFRFHKGPEKEGHTLYFWITTWEAEDDFLAWRIAELIHENVERAMDVERLRTGMSSLEDIETGLSRNTLH